jgi:glycosyltransferase involved in cell wall biosynthesis
MPKIAIIADWLTNQGGAEKVVFDLHQAFPDAPIYTSIYNPEKLPQFKKAKIHTSFLNNFPFAKNKHQLYLALVPYAFESFDLTEYDIVISSSFACAKGVITAPETTHICYCHNPMRYIWDESHQYVKEHNFNPILKLIAKPFLHKIRIWDRITADRVDHFIANSKFVANRIKKYYQRESTVIHPGIEFTHKNPQIKEQKENFYLAAGRIKAFKRFDLIVKAFNISKQNLKIVGTGEDLDRLKELNTNPNTEFLGFVSSNELTRLFQNAKGFIFPQAEDFGITPVEAQYFGCPVIAYGKGGALETVIKEKTGIFFDQQTEESLNQAISVFEKTKFDYQAIHEHAYQFNANNFIQKIKQFVNSHS